MTILNLLFVLFIMVNILSCSSSIEETRKEEVSDEEETYIFDEIPENEFEDEIPEEELYYLIQIGAFTTKQNAENFGEGSRKKLGKEISVSYNSDVNLFVVRLEMKFNNKKEAEIVRDELRKNEEFKDAWIVSSLK
jgi:cell division protein FtsN